MTARRRCGCEDAARRRGVNANCGINVMATAICRRIARGFIRHDLLPHNIIHTPTSSYSEQWNTQNHYVDE